jgi:hypothetical protein
MAFDEALADRFRFQLARHNRIEEKRMFGGVCFLRHGNIVVGVWKDSLIARLGPGESDAALQEPFVREFDITGKPMKGWVMAGPEGVEEDDQMARWVERATKIVKTLPAK